MIYLASPYSHPSSTMRQYRYEEARRALGWLWKNSKPAFSPIVYTHGLATELDLPYLAKDWQEMNDKILSICEEFYILGISGWRVSVGVNEEKKLWQQSNLNNIPHLMVPSKGEYIFQHVP